MSAEGIALSVVKPWSSFQCTGIHHAVRVRTYKGHEHLAYALIKSMAPLLNFFYWRSKSEKASRTKTKSEKKTSRTGQIDAVVYFGESVLMLVGKLGKHRRRVGVQ